MTIHFGLGSAQVSQSLINVVRRKLSGLSFDCNKTITINKLKPIIFNEYF